MPTGRSRPDPPAGISRLLLAAASLVLVGLVGCGGTFVAATTASPSAAAAGAPVPARMEIPPVAGKTWSTDILAVDQAGRRLYVADRTDRGIDVVDLSGATPRYMTTVGLAGEPQGIAVAADRKEVLAATRNALVAIIDVDPASRGVDTVVATVATAGSGADELAYDAGDRKVYVANLTPVSGTAEGFLSVIDPVARAVVKEVPNLGRLGGLTYDPGDGMLYVAGAGTNRVYRIDPRSDTIAAAVDVGMPCNPNGLGIDPATGQGVLTCGAPGSHPLAWDFTSGRALGDLAQAGTGDMALYDQALGGFLLAADGKPTPQIALARGSPPAYQASVATAKGSGSVAYDETHARILTVDPNPGEAGLWSLAVPTAPLTPSPLQTPAGASSGPSAGNPSGGGSLPARPGSRSSGNHGANLPAVPGFLSACAVIAAATVLIARRSSPLPARLALRAALASGAAQQAPDLAGARGLVAGALGAAAARPRLNEASWESLEHALLLAGVGPMGTSAILEDLRRANPGPAGLRDAFFVALVRMLDRRDRRLQLRHRGRTVWLVVGRDERSEATAAAALAGMLAGQGRSDVAVIPASGRSGDAGTPANETLLVIDARLGPDEIAAARRLVPATAPTGLVLIGVEGGAGSGIAVAAQVELGLPVKAIGFGAERPTVAFEPRIFAAAFISAPDTTAAATSTS